MGLALSRPMGYDGLPTTTTSYSEPTVTEFKSRHYVSILSWFGIFIGFLNLLGGRVLGLVQIATGGIGAYASWENCHERTRLVYLYTMANVFWTAIEGSFFLLLLFAKSEYLSNLVVGVFSRQTFPAFGEELSKLLGVLKENGGGFLMFSIVTKLIFDILAVVYGSRLYKEAIMYNASHEHMPLIGRGPRHGSRHGSPRFRPRTGSIAGLGSPPSPGRSSRSDKRSTHPFEGRGYRLGD